MKCYGKQKRMEQRSCALLLVAVLLVSAYFEAAEAQFFTKSNSKSIPRMGRRSIQEQQGASAYRRALVDRLVDEYGPNLLEVLQARAATDGSREFALRNEQPIDVADSFANYQDNSEADGSAVGVNVSRNERSSAPASQNYRDSSLAMRALNTKRLLQILSSGQPLMSADRMYLSGASGSDRGSKFSGDM